MTKIYFMLKKNVMIIPLQILLLAGAKNKEQSDGRIGRNLEWAPKIMRDKIFI